MEETGVYQYHVFVWAAFFFLYCLLGWIWESAYVSVRKHRWVNRGFLNGPFLPIYGCGAILVLFVTKPVWDNWVLVFLLGMCAATVLELVTGYVMEQIFQVKYWDYSKNRFNLGGYICLGCSLGWGAFSVFLVKVIHRPLERLVFAVPESVLTAADTALFLYFIWDVAYSAAEALSLRDVLREKVLANEELQRLQRRLDELVRGSGLENLQEELHRKVESYREEKSVEIARIRQEIEQQRHIFEEHLGKRQRHALRILKRNPGSISRRHKLTFEQIREYLEDNRKNM